MPNLDNQPKSEGSSLLIHFERTKADVVRALLNELHTDYQEAMKVWTKDPTIAVVGNYMLAHMMKRMGCEISIYDKDFGYYYIDLPHSELQ